MTTTTRVTGRAWAAALALAAALRGRDTEAAEGQRWRRRRQPCPWWCAADHRCTARHGYPSGEHRSAPLSWRTHYGLLVATRVQTIAGSGHLELRASIRLPADEDAARGLAQRLPVGVDLTIRAITSLPVVPAGPDRRALPGPASAASGARLPLKAGAGRVSFMEPPQAA